MRRPLWAVLAGLAAALGGCASTTIAVDPAAIRAHQDYLASPELRGRGSATEDEAKAAAYVAERFAAYGLKPAPGRSSFLQAFAVPPSPITRRQAIPDNAKSRNVIGFLPGTDPAAGYILLSAHLDHLGVLGGRTFIGANDDASGTTALLELARLLASHGPLPPRDFVRRFRRRGGRARSARAFSRRTRRSRCATSSPISNSR